MSTFTCNYKSLSKCNTISALVYCSKQIYQSSNANIEIQLLDNNTSTTLDLTLYDEIYIYLYDERDKLIYKFSNIVVTDTFDLNIMQYTDTNGYVIDGGKVSINLTSDITSDLLSGNLYCEVVLKQINTSGDNIVVIPCFKIADIIFSRYNTLDYENRKYINETIDDEKYIFLV